MTATSPERSSKEAPPSSRRSSRASSHDSAADSQNSLEEGEASDRQSSPEPQGDSDEAESKPAVERPTAQSTGAIPPLPDEPVPEEDDGWECKWSAEHNAWYFSNRFTQQTQWENPRVPSATTASAPGTVAPAPSAPQPPAPVAGGYNPAIHGDFDPNASYALEYRATEEGGGEEGAAVPADANLLHVSGGYFNKASGQFQQAGQGAERHTDEAKSRRQMNAFFDVDAAANSHDGRSLKAERSGKKPSKAELKAFKEKRRAKKEEKRRAWLRD